jgi:hypothetical protein
MKADAHSVIESFPLLPKRLNFIRYRVVIEVVYRKTLDGPWICSWNCGFRSYDLDKVIEHENKGEH